MRWSTLVWLLIGGGVVLWMLGIVGGPRIGADTRVQVLTTEPVRVLLPVDAGATFIESRLREQLAVDATAQRDERMSKHMTKLSRDDELMDYIAESGYEQFDSDIAAGIAYGLYDVDIGEDVVLYSVTVELLPSYYNVGATLSHEDGHWLVNTGVAQRCGPRIVREASSGTLFAGQARFAIVSELQIADEAVHNEYHRLVVGATSGQHRTSALQALDDVIGPACERRR